jgi:Cap4 SAVED domain
MIWEWLEEKERKSHKFSFHIIDLTETSIRAHQQFPSWLASELLVAYKDPAHLKYRYGQRERQELRDYLSTEVFPPTTTTLEKNTRRGDWGEIVTGLVLRDIRKLETTLIKLRYKLNKKKSSFGIDVFGVQTDSSGKIVGLCICETKTKITYDKDIGCKAYNSLMSNDTSAIISIADFMSTIYFNAGRFDLVDQFDDIVVQKAKFPTEHHIFLVHEKSLWNDEILMNLSNVPNLLQGLKVNVLLIDELDDLVEKSCALVPDVGEDIVYGTT